MVLKFMLWIVRLVRQLADRLDPPAAERVLDVLQLNDAAESLVRKAATMSLGDEARRHFVYARLVKAFPDVRRRVISRAIEDALDRVEG